MAKAWPDIKDPDDVADYRLDWATEYEGWVDGDAIATSTWTIVSGDVVIAVSPAPSNTATVAKVWLSAGTAGNCVLLNRITTTGGRTLDQSVRLKIRAR